MKTKLLLLALLLGASTWIASAQDEQPAPAPRQRPPRDEAGGPGRPGGPGGPGRPGMRPMPGPLFAVLDANHDGVIDEKEIEHAAETLKTLDKDGDGKITPMEIHPPRPQGMPGPGAARGPRGPRGPSGAGRGHGPGGPPLAAEPGQPASPSPEQ